MGMMLIQALCYLIPVLLIVGAVLYVTSPKWRDWLHDVIDDIKSIGEGFSDTFRN